MICESWFISTLNLVWPPKSSQTYKYRSQPYLTVLSWESWFIPTIIFLAHDTLYTTLYPVHKLTFDMSSYVGCHKEQNMSFVPSGMLPKPPSLCLVGFDKLSKIIYSNTTSSLPRFGNADVPAYSDSLRTRPVTSNQAVTVSRGNLLTNQSFGACQKCHCRWSVTVNNVTVSGDVSCLSREFL